MDRHFRLGTTSFIYPDHILPNVRRIGIFFDEIELLMFESEPRDVLPSQRDIRELVRLSGDLNLTYNVHLPTDIHLAAPSAPARQQAADRIARVMDLCEPLDATTHTLHLETGGDDGSNGSGCDSSERVTDEWTGRAMDGLDRLVPLLPRPDLISLETLDYPPKRLLPFLERYELNVCIDAGHHFKYGYDLAASLDLFKERVPLIHLHGFGKTKKGVRDHTGLDRLDPVLFEQTVGLLAGFHGTVSLEVFNRDDLNRSLGVLSKAFTNIPEKL